MKDKGIASLIIILVGVFILGSGVLLYINAKPKSSSLNTVSQVTAPSPLITATLTVIPTVMPTETPKPVVASVPKLNPTTAPIPTNPIHTAPAVVNLDCIIKLNSSAYEGKELSCGSDDSIFKLTLFAPKNDKIIEVRTFKNAGDSRGIVIGVNGTSSNTMYPGQDSYTLQMFPLDGVNPNLSQEPNGSYHGYFSFVDQATQKELVRIPYTLSIQAK